MKVAEEKAGSVAAQKEKIRERYKGIDSDMLDVIPAIPPEDFYHTQVTKRVGGYARVSTDSAIVFASSSEYSSFITALSAL